MGRATVYITVALCLGITASSIGYSIQLRQYVDTQAMAIQSLSQTVQEAIDNDRKLKNVISQWVERDVAILDALIPGYADRLNESRGNTNGSEDNRKDGGGCADCH